MAIVMFSPLLPAPWQIVGCGIGIGLTIVFVRRYVQLIKAQKQEGAMKITMNLPVEPAIFSNSYSSRHWQTFARIPARNLYREVCAGLAMLKMAEWSAGAAADYRHGAEQSLCLYIGNAKRRLSR